MPGSARWLTPHTLTVMESVVSGTVFYVQRSALSTTARVTVRLADVSHADAPPAVIAEQVIETDGRQVPFAFSLAYDPAQIDQEADYAVSAQIDEEGHVFWTTTERHAVITGGNPIADLQLRLDPAD